MATGNTPASKLKTINKTETPGTDEVSKINGYELQDALPIPSRHVPTRTSGGSLWDFAAMEIGQSFLVPITAPDTITDPKERELYVAEACRKESNRVSNAVRNFKKRHEDKEYHFTARTVDENKEPEGHKGLGTGIRVWRTEAPKK